MFDDLQPALRARRRAQASPRPAVEASPPAGQPAGGDGRAFGCRPHIVGGGHGQQASPGLAGAKDLASLDFALAVKRAADAM